MALLAHSLREVRMDLFIQCLREVKMDLFVHCVREVKKICLFTVLGKLESEGGKNGFVLHLFAYCFAGSF